LRLSAAPDPSAAPKLPLPAPVITTDTEVRPGLWMALALVVVAALAWLVLK